MAKLKDNMTTSMKNIENNIRKLVLAIKKQSSRPLMSEIEDEADDIWDFEILNLSFEEEI